MITAMPRNQEFLDALETAREGVMSRLARHDPEGVAHPAHIEAIVQRHAEQLHAARSLEGWKKESV